MNKNASVRSAGHIPNTGLQALADVIHKYQRILITSHAQGDGDSVGSSLALALGLLEQGKQANILLADFPDKYRFLDQDGLIEVVSAPISAEFSAQWELGIVLDATEPERLGEFGESFINAPFEKICLDHHLVEKRQEYLVHYSDPTSPSTGSLVLSLLDCLQIPLSPPLAKALFVAIATDTGWFRYSNTTSDVFRDISRLMEAGASPDPLYHQIYEQLPFPRLTLQAKVLERVKTAFEGAYLWSTLDMDTIRNSGVARTAFEGLIDPLRTVAGARIVSFFSETDKGVWKISLRSRGRCDVEKIASRFGGGGHAKAAGCTVEGSLEEVENTVLKEVETELKVKPK